MKNNIKNKKVKALGLSSGGLDSILAGKVLEQQDIDVTWITFETPFFSAANAVKASKLYDIPVIKTDITEIYLEMLRNPPLGYGKNMNPCRDCHALMFRLAGEVMKKEGFDFLFSGEVAGQRPLSQNKNALRYVEKNSGSEGFILRPLSAKNLPETEAEQKGLVDREQLLNITGRSRKAQVQLAKDLGIHDYPSPAGGCLLTDKNFSNRLRDLFGHQKSCTSSDLHLLKFGRHIRLNENVKIVVGRTKGDNDALTKYYRPEEHILLDAKDIGSPTILMPCNADSESIKQAASICCSYTKTPEGETASILVKESKKTETIKVYALTSDKIKELMV